MNDIPLPMRPMILPWLAHKAGIGERRAETLWHGRPQRHAATRHGLKAETPAYWKAAMDRLLELIAAESLREDAASFGWRPLAAPQSPLSGKRRIGRARTHWPSALHPRLAHAGTHDHQPQLLS